jgi:sugar phosphate isomerase/epimerase
MKDLNRRRLLQLAAGGVVEAAALAAGRGFRFRHVVSTCLYGHGRVEAIFPEVRKTGAAFIDVWPEKYGSQREQIEEMGHEKFRALLEKNRLSVGVLSRYDLGPFGLAKELEVAREFGCRTIVCGAGGPRDLAGSELKQAVRDFAEKMKPHLDAAAKASVTIAIENHGGSLTATPEALEWLVEFAPPPLGIALAPFHLEQDPVRLAALIRALKNRIAFFYAWQRGQGLRKELTPDEVREQLPGRGGMDFGPIAAALRDTGYTGWVSVFMHTMPGGIPIRETTRGVTEEIVRAMGYMDRCLERAGSRV